MSAAPQILTTQDVQQINWGNALKNDYYALLEIRYEFDDENYETIIVGLLFETPKGIARDVYTIKVLAGMTMWEAIRGALRKDFNYPPESGSFFAEAYHTADTITDESGNRYGKILSVVTVTQKFKTANLAPHGMKVHWEEWEEDI